MKKMFVEEPEESRQVNSYLVGFESDYQFWTRFTKVDFPKFKGDDVEWWIYRCERFFEVDHTPIISSVKLAFVHLSRKALE